MTQQIDKLAYVHPSVCFGGDVYIGRNCIIGQPGFQHGDWTPLDFFEPGLTPSTRIGPGARIMGGTVICYGAQIGARFRCDYQCYIGEYATIGDDVVLEYGGRIYDRCQIGSGSTIGGFICNDCVVGEGSVVQGALVHKRAAAGSERSPRIGSGCLIGTNATVVGDVEVADGTVLAAGSVLLENTEAGHLYAGVPARKLRLTGWV